MHTGIIIHNLKQSLSDVGLSVFPEADIHAGSLDIDRV